MRLLLAGLILCFCSSAFSQPKYEFRGVWIATVDNIDWPKRGVTDVAQQKADFIRILDLHQRNGMNTMVVQVRPAADAFYPSPYEPWSQWLTGVQGKAPSPYYDPLQFMIEETHKRGMEFHAWLNPYRANFNIKTASIAKNHITRVHPEWFITYGDTKYFDPGNLEGQKFVENVVRDIVKRYEVDGIHMDDYFYPYPIGTKEFPDGASYKKSGTTLSRADWRRSNVDTIIHQLSIIIKEEKPLCKFGVSPFCVWRNKSQDPEGSDTKAAINNYDDLYADILLWLKNGWIDYVTPQLYLEIGNERVDYATMVDWWANHSYGRHVYIGHGIYRAYERNKAWKSPDELPNQIKLLRENPNIQGSLYFSSKTFDGNPNGWNDSLRNNYYRLPALIPPMDWLQTKRLEKPDSLEVGYLNTDIRKPEYTLMAYRRKSTYDVRAMIVYISPKKEEVLSRSSKALKFVVTENKRNNAIAFNEFSPADYYKKEKKYFVGSSFEYKNGGESEVSNVITVTRQKNGSVSFSKP
jgi:uncharacterized lipoprotein YddW (UPF0748 family)